MNFAEPVLKLVEERLSKINTLAIGTLTKVDLSKWRADVRLKTKIQGQNIEIANVPIALQMFTAGSLQIAPAVGDVVIIGVSKHEIQKQLRNRDVVEANEQVLYNINHAVILSGGYVESDAVPSVAANEILIQHSSGTSIRFKANGDLDITASHINWIKKT